MSIFFCAFSRCACFGFRGTSSDVVSFGVSCLVSHYERLLVAWLLPSHIYRSSSRHGGGDDELDRGVSPNRPYKRRVESPASLRLSETKAFLHFFVFERCTWHSRDSLFVPHASRLARFLRLAYPIVHLSYQLLCCAAPAFWRQEIRVI